MEELIEPELNIEGYRLCACGCGRQELLHVAHLTGGVSWECFREGKLARVRQLEVMHRGRQATIIVPKAPKPASSRGSKATKRKVEHSRRAAARRLINLYRDVYDVLVDDERHKRGLLPIPRVAPEGCHVSAIETLGA